MKLLISLAEKNIKKTIYLSIIYLLSGSSPLMGQFITQDVLLMKKNNVKSRSIDSFEKDEYSYTDSSIIRNSSKFDGNNYQYIYYINEKNLIDSVSHGKYLSDSIRINKEYNYYNSKNQLIKKEFPPSSVGVSSTRNYFYDESGNLDSIYLISKSNWLSIIPAFKDSIETSISTYSFKYDEANKLILEKRADSHGLEVIEFQYDAKGRIQNELSIFTYYEEEDSYPLEKNITEVQYVYHQSGYQENRIETGFTLEPDGTKIKKSENINYYLENGLLKKVVYKNTMAFDGPFTEEIIYNYTFYEN